MSASLECRARLSGVTLFDTADVYAPSWDTFGHHEELVAEAIGNLRTLVDDDTITEAVRDYLCIAIHIEGL